MRKLIFCALTATCLLGNAGENVIVPSGYTRMVFNDEFNSGDSPDSSKWGYEHGYLRNGEMQYYTDRRDNCYVEDGLLHIVARNDSAMLDGKIRPVTSASIQTAGKHSWKYCYVEVRAKVPACLGSWPAIWMMPEKSVYGDWPKSGEIDIMEHVGYEPEKVHYAVHSYKYNHKINTQKNHQEARNVVDEFHTFAFEWKEDSLSWILDGEVMFTVNKDEDGWEAWPFDQEFYLKLNFAFGGGWGGCQGVNVGQLPLDYQIDYVRVFK